jgi:diguanylate cyclase (GGDEF)-like protein
MEGIRRMALSRSSLLDGVLDSAASGAPVTHRQLRGFPPQLPLLLADKPITGGHSPSQRGSAPVQVPPQSLRGAKPGEHGSCRAHSALVSWPPGLAFPHRRRALMSWNNKSKIIQAAQKHLAKGNLYKAVKEYEKILEEQPDDNNTRLKAAELYERLGQGEKAVAEYRRVAEAFTQAGFYPKGLAVLNRVLAIDPELREVHLELAELNQKLGRVSESVRHYQKAAVLEERQGEKLQSIDILKKIADLDPENIDRKLDVAALYYKEGYPDAGFEQFCDALTSLDPASEEFLDLTKRMCKAQPGDQRLKLRLGEAHLNRGEVKAALEVLEAAAAIERSSRAVELLAEAKAQTDQIEDAKSLFEEAINLYKADWDHSKRRELSARVLEISADLEEGPPEVPAPSPAAAKSPSSPDADAPAAALHPTVPEQDAPSASTSEGRRAPGGLQWDSTSESVSGPGAAEGMPLEKQLDTRLAEADACLKAGDWRGTIAILEELARQYPTRTDPLFRLREIYEGNNDWAAVGRVSGRLAFLMEERGDLARAERFASEARAAEGRAARGEQPRSHAVRITDESPVRATSPRTSSSGNGGSAGSGGGQEGFEILIRADDMVRSDAPLSQGGPARGEPPRGRPAPPGQMSASGSEMPLEVSVMGEGELRSLIDAEGSEEDRYVMEKTVLSTAFRHALTGLPIRALFMDRLETALRRAKSNNGYSFAVLVLDLDRFKLINDSLGHAVGDELLVAIARRLEECLGEANTAAYLGGDEFTILLEEARDPSSAMRVAEKIKGQLSLPFNVKGHEVFTSASIGIAMSSTGYERSEDLMRDADTAMYRAKARGKARYELFDKGMHSRAVALLQLETDLRRAVERGEFEIHYQPIVTLATGKLAGFEALARWHHPDGSLVSPKDFIPIAEEIALVIPIDRWVLHEACRQLRIWQDRYPSDPPLTVNVNLSGKHFAKPDLVPHIEQVLKDTRVDPPTLKLEITESVVMENVDSASSILTRLKALDVRLNVDDFGTGHSSLASLHRYPFDTLKIDRSFVTNMEGNTENAEIVRTILSLGRNLGMSVVAEGVENEQQLALLRELGCTYGQGFFFSKPLGKEEADALIKSDIQW